MGRKGVGEQGFSDVTIAQGLTSSRIMTSKFKNKNRDIIGVVYIIIIGDIIVQI